MQVDPSTLYGVVFAGAAASSVLFWSRADRPESDASAGAWAFAFSLVACYFGLVLMASSLPSLIGIGLANGLAVVLMATMHRGACVLCRQPFHPWAHALAATVVTFIIALYLSDAVDGYDGRVQLVGMVTALQCGFVAATMTRPDAGIGLEERTGRRLVAVAFGALGTLQGARVLAHSPLVAVDEPAILAQTALSAGAAAGFLIWSLAVPVLVFYIHEARARQALRSAVVELQEALGEVQTLRELLPMCASCRRIRHNDDKWSPLEDYLLDRTGVRMTHGLCPDCMTRLYPEFFPPKAT